MAAVVKLLTIWAACCAETRPASRYARWYNAGRRTIRHVMQAKRTGAVMIQGMLSGRGTSGAAASASAGRQRNALAVLLALGGLLSAAFGALGMSGALPPLAPEEASGLLMLAGLVLGLMAVGVATEQVRFRGADEAAVLAASWEALPAATVVVRRNGRPVLANGAYRALMRQLGRRRLVAPEHLFAGVPEVSARLYRMQRRLVADGGTVREDIRLAPDAMNGEERWLRVRARVFDCEGKPCELWQIVDVTEERRQEARALRRLQESVAALDDLPAGVMISRADGKVVHLNATLARWVGIEAVEVEHAGLRREDVLPEELVARLGALDGGKDVATVQETQTVMRNAVTGAMQRMRVVHQLLPGGEGLAQTLVLPMRQERDPLFEQVERFILHAPAGMALADAKGRITLVNAVLAQAAGNRLTVGGELCDLVAPQDRKRLRAAFEAVVGGERERMQLDVYLFEGEDTRAQVTLAPAPGGGVVAHVIDTTLKQTLMEQIEHGQIMQQIGIMAAQLAHDFNNLLTPVMGSADILLQRLRVTDPTYELVHKIKSHTWEAAKIVEQLLAFSRRQTMQPQVLMVNDWLIREVRLLRSILKKGNTKLETDYGADWLVKVDPRKLDRVIVNLVRNAEDAMPDGGRITIRTRNVPAAELQGRMAEVMTVGDYVLIEVEDTGQGIPPEVMEKIFEPFYTTKPMGKGTGLGLATVYGIVKQSGGYVFCDSAVGQGTTFRIYLPRHVETEEERRKRREDERKKNERKAQDLTGSGIILLAEDEDSVREFAVQALQMRGYTVVDAASAELALDLAQERLAGGGSFDLIVSDVVMPGMDGPSMVRQLREMGVKAPVVFMSGHAEDSFEQNLDDDLPFVFLTKPFDLRTIAEAVKEAFAGGGARRGRNAARDEE